MKVKANERHPNGFRADAISTLGRMKIDIRSLGCYALLQAGALSLTIKLTVLILFRKTDEVPALGIPSFL
jgi:hypothetical protein